MKLRTVSLLICAMFFLSGCDVIANVNNGISITDGLYEIPLVEAEEEYADSGEIANDGSVSLEWDADRLALLLKDQNGGVWGSLPHYQYESMELGGGAKRYVESHLFIDYIEPDTMNIKTLNSYIGAYENGRVYSALIENGIRITYYFDEIGIVIPVEYTLVDGALQVSVDCNEIHEDIFKLYRIHILPFCASTPNSREDYILFPDGSGVLLYCDKDKGTNNFSSQVYGNDPAFVEIMKNKNTAAARMPVFGIKSGDYALCGIITQSEGAAEINGTTGDLDVNYSNVYASFYVRGKDLVKVPEMWGRKLTLNKYSNKMPDNFKIAVRYYPLKPAGQAYIAIADTYRNYLIKEKGLKKQGEDQLLYFDVSMAATIRKFYFGLPFDVTTTVTDYKQVKEIISQTISNTNVNPVVRLSGIQKGGVEVGKIGGGFRFEGVLGSEKDRKTLFEYADKNEVSLYPDFDIVRFRKSSGGFNSSAAIKAPTTLTAYQYFYNLATKERDTEKYRYMLLTPAKLMPAFEKLMSLIERKQIDYISLSTLGNTAYSDYRDSRYYLRSGFSETVNQIQNAARNNGIKLMYEEANDYAAVAAAHIISAPTKTSRYFGEGHPVPFYQIVLKGYIPMSTAAINLQDSPTNEVLMAVSTGIGLLYSVCGTETLDYVSSPYTPLSSGKFSKIQTDVFQTVKRFQEVFDATKDAQIADYIVLDPGVYKTVFNNGTMVIVNFTKNDYRYGNTVVASMGYYFETGGEA